MAAVPGWVLLVYLLLVPAATLLGFLGQGGNALLYVLARKSVPPHIGGQVHRMMRTAERVVARRRPLLMAAAPLYLGGLVLALLWPAPGLFAAFLGGVCLGYVAAAHLVHRLWMRLKPLVPDGPTMTLGAGIDLALQRFPLALFLGGCFGVAILLALAWQNPDKRWIAWLAILPGAQALASGAWVRRQRRRSSGPIRKGP